MIYKWFTLGMKTRSTENLQVKNNIIRLDSWTVSHPISTKQWKLDFLSKESEHRRKRSSVTHLLFVLINIVKTLSITCK